MMLRVTDLTGFGAVGLRAAMKLLSGEAEGMASDFTVAGGHGAVAVKDSTTAANNVSNVRGDAWWTNSGTSPKLVTGSDGVLRWSPHNMVIQSENIENGVGWSAIGAVTTTLNDAVAPDGTTTADLVTNTTGATDRLRTSTITTISGASYTARIRVKGGTTQWLFVNMTDTSTHAFQMWVDITNGTIGTTNVAGSDTIISTSIQAAANGFYDIWISGTHANTSILFDLISVTADGGSTRAAGTYWLWGAQFNRGAVPTDYLATTTAARFGLGIDYSNSSYGLLVEPAATNLLVQSQDLTTSWTNDGTTDAGNTAAAPDGETTADTITDDNTNARHRIYLSPTITSDATYTLSCYAKQALSPYVIVSIGTAGATDHFVSAAFDLSAGTAGDTAVGATSGTLVGSTITALANGWYRCTVTGSITRTDGRMKIATATSASPTFNNSGEETYQGASDRSVYIWGAQLETGTVATSPIPTFAATVTRAANNVNKALSALPFSATEGTLYVDYLTPAFAQADTVFAWQIDDGTSNERLRVFHTTGAAATFSVVDGGSTQVSIAAGTIAYGTRAQVTAAWKANLFAASANGAASGDDTSGTLPTVTTIRAGTTHTGNQLNGWVRRMVWVPRQIEEDADTVEAWRYEA